MRPTLVWLLLPSLWHAHSCHPLDPSVATGVLRAKVIVGHQWPASAALDAFKASEMLSQISKEGLRSGIGI